MDRWELLGSILKDKGGWTDAQRGLAFDLIGVPAALRDGSGVLPPPEDVAGLAAVVEGHYEGLREVQEAVLDEVDASERAMAMGGMPLEEDAPTARLRKYEGSCRRAFNAARAELLRLREAKATASEPFKAEPPPSHKAPLSEAAIDNLVKRSRIATEMQAAERSAQATAPAVERPSPSPSPSRSAPVPAAAPMNRRERRAQEKRDRQAARRASR